MAEQLKVWIAGQPASFATAGARYRKDAITAQMPAPSGHSSSGMMLKFSLQGDFGWPAHPDIDNLCEPVCSTAINRLRWFGGSRPNLDWYLATKCRGPELGALITVVTGPAPEVATVGTGPGLSATWPGPLPRSARDEGFVAW